nr:MAG TPA: hypothetical protein [Caudoviricetes sp.]
MPAQVKGLQPVAQINVVNPTDPTKPGTIGSTNQQIIAAVAGRSTTKALAALSTLTGETVTVANLNTIINTVNQIITAMKDTTA